MAGELSAEDRDELAIPSYVHRNPAMRWMAWRRVEVVGEWIGQILRKCATRKGADEATVVDFGCGTGVLLEECSRGAKRVYGVDLVLSSSRLLVGEWGLKKVELLTPPEAEQVVAPGSVDLVVAAEVLEHVEPLGPTLELFKKWLSPDGTLLVSLPTESALYRFGRRLAGFSGHYHHANAASLHAEIVAAGFRPVRKHTIPLPGPAAIYWVIEYARP
jgi:2-polyprenyl-3-methyl-5-hydroxy-6-metoxy-1,4-benzoquinol methylase